MAAHGIRPDVLVEVDSGHHRTGVPPAAAGDLARYAAKAGFAVRGVFTFPGHSYSTQTRASAADDEAAALAVAAQSLAAQGIPCQVRSGGSTPSAAFAAGSVGGVGRVGDGIGGLTELRPGVYVFGDAQQVELGVCALEDVALTVVATVVSHAGGRVILDAGSKALGADRAPWATGFGRVQEAPDARIVALSEHHATVEWGSGPLPALGLARAGRAQPRVHHGQPGRRVCARGRDGHLAGRCARAQLVERWGFPSRKVRDNFPVWKTTRVCRPPRHLLRRRGPHPLGRLRRLKRALQLGALGAWTEESPRQHRLVTPTWYHPVPSLALVFVFVAGAASERFWVVTFAAYWCRPGRG
jgi:hypothetical protein